MDHTGINADVQAGGGQPPAVELVGLNKHFGSVHANKNVTMSVPRGTVHGIVGENGAGKSTMMALLYGFYQADSGHIRINGKQVTIKSPTDAIAQGIGMVHQHFMLVEPFTVLENVILGAESGALIKPSLKRARSELVRLASEYGLQVDPDAVVGDLPVGIQQRVEILKALYRGAETLILDEPTGVLTPQEADHLFRILDTLRQQGKTVILITHKLREIMSITDNVSVMRQGAMVAHRKTAETSKEELAELMVGRKVLLRVEKTPATPGECLVRLENVSCKDESGVERLKDVSLSICRGEILGIAGVSGNGQSELLSVLSGIMPVSSGKIVYRNEVIASPEVRTGATFLRSKGIGHVAEDRHRMGMVMEFSAAENAILGYHRDPEFNGAVWMDQQKIHAKCSEYMSAFDVRPNITSLPGCNFSGGNQQKLVLAREMEQNPDLLLVGQPTRGVDIGAIEFIHNRIIAMRDKGMAVMLVSVELDEIMSLADRIIVMFDGRIVGEVAGGEADERQLGLMMAGISPDDAKGGSSSSTDAGAPAGDSAGFSGAAKIRGEE